MSFNKMFYWLFKIGAPLTLAVYPMVAMYGSVVKWAPAENILAQYPSETAIMVGFYESKSETWHGDVKVDNSVSAREYVLYPSVFKAPKVISISQEADKSLDVEESLFGFIRLIVWYLVCIIATWFLWFKRKAV